MKRGSSATIAVVISVLAGPISCFGWNQGAGSVVTIHNKGARRCRNILRAESSRASTAETTLAAPTADVPYVVTRGDGSTGGGGLPMPKQMENHELFESQRRPKVGAEMPRGRPSWFKVPAPSQCKNLTGFVAYYPKKNRPGTHIASPRYRTCSGRVSLSKGERIVA
jgi:hypothetical protein